MVINEKFGERHYNGNPLGYFMENFDVYNGMNRNKFSKFDPGLYRALGRAGQLEQAIPKARESSVKIGRRLGKGELALSEKDIDTILKSYTKYNCNTSEASRHLPYAASTIWRYWKVAGFKIRKKIRIFRSSKEQIEEILDSYERYDGNASEASRNLFCSGKTIRKYWRNSGLKIRKKGVRFSDEQIEEILDSYERYDKNATEASRHLPYAVSTLWRRWKEKGLKTKKSWKRKKN